jgi:hypothetical protein
MSVLRVLFTTRALRLLAISYALKTLLVAGVWALAPDLFAHALAEARAAVERLGAALGVL